MIRPGMHRSLAKRAGYDLRATLVVPLKERL